MSDFNYKAKTNSLSDIIQKGDTVKIILAQSYCNGDIVAVASEEDISVIEFKKANEMTPGDILVIGKVAAIIKQT
jgi:SOS-response transcriptional repressor LexA